MVCVAMDSTSACSPNRRTIAEKVLGNAALRTNTIDIAWRRAQQPSAQQPTAHNPHTACCGSRPPTRTSSVCAQYSPPARSPIMGYDRATKNRGGSRRMGSTSKSTTEVK